MGMLWAHSANPLGERHGLREHLLGTSALAGEFAGVFGAREAGAALGLLHDVGKLTQSWQDYLLRAEKARTEGGRRPSSPDHKGPGASLAGGCTGWPGRLSILGHHGRLENKVLPPPAGAELDAMRAELVDLVPEAAAFLEGPVRIPAAWLAAQKSDPGAIEFGTRLLHSALVDADYLDTSAHFGATSVQRPPPADFGLLQERFDEARADVLGRRRPSPVDTTRQAVYEAARAAASGAPGIYRLHAPTGSGKTLAGAGFALHHAARHGHRRVIVAVPFLTITEQNAAVYRTLLGADMVLEHHSGIEPSGLQRYGVENWDAPFVVTTTVQLFESFFSGKPSRSRKLHRLARSVIVLDEVQAIPLHALSTVLDGLRILVQHFGATVLLASATQPPFESLQVLAGRDVHVTAVVPDPVGLYRSMRRVRTRWEEVATQGEVARVVGLERQALLVVNTTAEARDLARALRERVDDEVLHLSTRMCQAHRRAVLSRINALLADDSPVKLVSTQLIEAGVDVDFPVVFRALAPAESLLQAAGRANREGRCGQGRLVILTGAGVKVLRAYETGVAKTLQVFGQGRQELDDPRQLERYYRLLYGAQNPDEVPDALRLRHLRDAFQFKTVGEAFRMIDDDATAVIARYNEDAMAAIDALCEAARQGATPTRADLRALQPYAVSLPTSLIHSPGVEPYVEEVIPGVRVWSGPYDDLVGVDTSAGPHDSLW